MKYQWDFSFLLHNWPLLLVGLGNTIRLSAVALIAGILIGIVIGVGRTSHSRFVALAATAYVEVFRNLPGLVLIFWFYYALPILTGWQSSIWLASTVALSVYTGAYCAEICRAGIESIDRGQWEVGQALGMNRWMQLRLIVLPQALRRMIPAFTNRAIELVKATTLASTLSFGELLYNTKMIAEDQLRPLEAYTVVTLIFTLILIPVSYMSIKLERKYISKLGTEK